MTIKHLILSGGSWKGLYMIGTIDKLIDSKYFILDEIESIWATSAGTIVAILLSLKIDWKDIIKYFINIPLNHYEMNLDFYLSAFKECGLLDKKFFINLLDSVFKAKQLDLQTITLKEFHEFSGKEIHFFSVKYETMETIDFNYKKNPDLKLLDVMYCSCTFPLLFKPIKINNEIYLDGGINVHYPIDYCLQHNNPDEIFGIYIKTNLEDKDEFKNLYEFGTDLIFKIVFSKQKKLNNKLKNQVTILTKGKGLDGIFKLIKNKGKREEIINTGRVYGEEFLDNRLNKLG
jgi:predicted acylesterase/phospholipase RssA